MRTTLYSLLFILGSVFLFTQCDKQDDPMNQKPLNNKKSVESCVTIQELWAGAGQNDLSKGTLVGTVTASFESENVLVVTYNVNPGWDLSEAHVWIGSDFSSVPKKAAPGKFPYATYSAPWEFHINLSDHGIELGDPIYVAAHGVVCSAGDGVDLQGLPLTVPFTHDGTNLIIGGESSFAGAYSKYIVWCIESTNPNFSLNTDYEGTLYSTLGDIPDGLVDYPENFDLVNWVINQGFVGQPATGCEGNYTDDDVQYAIWKLLEAEPSSEGVEDYSECRVDEIVALALANGEGFVPGCGDRVTIILDHATVQDHIFEVPMPCMDCETAWAYGAYPFIDLGITRNWGWIFGIDCFN